MLKSFVNVLVISFATFSVTLLAIAQPAVQRGISVPVQCGNIIKDNSFSANYEEQIFTIHFYNTNGGW